MEKKIHNKLVRDNIPNIISNNGEYFSIRTLSDEELEKETNKKMKEELNEVINSKTNEELTSELGDLLEVILLKAELHNISFDDIEKSRLKKQEKNGAFNKRIFLISTADKEYVDHNKGCITCINGSCTLPTNEKYDYEDDGKPAGYYCVGYKSVYEKLKK